MGWFSSDICGCCGNEVDVGIKSNNCGHWMCANCIIQRSAVITHFFGSDTLACPACGKDTGFIRAKVIARLRGED